MPSRTPTRRFNRATSGLKRLVVIGHSGFVTLEALRWLKGIDAALVQIGPDGELVAMTAAERFHNTKLRRARGWRDIYAGAEEVTPLSRVALRARAGPEAAMPSTFRLPEANRQVPRGELRVLAARPAERGAPLDFALVRERAFPRAFLRHWFG